MLTSTLSGTVQEESSTAVVVKPLTDHATQTEPTTGMQTCLAYLLQCSNGEVNVKELNLNVRAMYMQCLRVYE